MKALCCYLENVNMNVWHGEQGSAHQHAEQGTMHRPEPGNIYEQPVLGI